MLPRSRKHLTAGLLVIAVAIVSGCPLKFEEENRINAEPNTFFDRAPDDTTFVNEVTFRWVGTDLDSDVVAFQYQLVEVDSLYYFSGGLEGTVTRSLDPRSESGEERWSDRLTDRFLRFSDLDDGWYEMRVRAIDNRNQSDPTPARSLFFVFFDDRPPTPIFEAGPLSANPPCGVRLTAPRYAFYINALDVSRNSVTPRSKVEYSVRLRAQSSQGCEHGNDSFTPWRRFPDDGTTPIVIGNGTDPDRLSYDDLTGTGCTWNFTLRLRDPAGNINQADCSVQRF